MNTLYKELVSIRDYCKEMYQLLENTTEKEVMWTCSSLLNLSKEMAIYTLGVLKYMEVIENKQFEKQEELTQLIDEIMYLVNSGTGIPVDLSNSSNVKYEI